MGIRVVIMGQYTLIDEELFHPHKRHYNRDSGVTGWYFWFERFLAGVEVVWGAVENIPFRPCTLHD